MYTVIESWDQQTVTTTTATTSPTRCQGELRALLDSPPRPLSGPGRRNTSPASPYPKSWTPAAPTGCRRQRTSRARSYIWGGRKCAIVGVPWRGSVSACLAWGDMVSFNMLSEVLKMLSILRRQGMPMRAHLQLPGIWSIWHGCTAHDVGGVIVLLLHAGCLPWSNTAIYDSVYGNLMLACDVWFVAGWNLTHAAFMPRKMPDGSLRCRDCGVRMAPPRPPPPLSLHAPSRVHCLALPILWNPKTLNPKTLNNQKPWARKHQIARMPLLTAHPDPAGTARSGDPAARAAPRSESPFLRGVDDWNQKRGRAWQACSSWQRACLWTRVATIKECVPLVLIHYYC